MAALFLLLLGVKRPQVREVGKIKLGYLIDIDQQVLVYNEPAGIIRTYSLKPRTKINEKTAYHNKHGVARRKKIVIQLYVN